jgi:hypothetical protein
MHARKEKDMIFETNKQRTEQRTGVLLGERAQTVTQAIAIACAWRGVSRSNDHVGAVAVRLAGWLEASKSRGIEVA